VGEERQGDEGEYGGVEKWKGELGRIKNDFF